MFLLSKTYLSVILFFSCFFQNNKAKFDEATSVDISNKEDEVSDKDVEDDYENDPRYSLTEDQIKTLSINEDTLSGIVK